MHMHSIELGTDRSRSQSLLKDVDNSSQTADYARSDYIHIGLYSITMFAVSLTISIQNPFVSAILAAADFSKTGIGLALSMQYWGAIVTSVLAGYLGDPSRLRRKAVLCAGLLLQGAGTVALAWLGRQWEYFLVIFIQGAGMAAVYTTVFGLIMDAFPGKHEHVLSIVQTTAGVGWLFGPLLIGTIWHLSSSPNIGIYICGVLQILCAVLDFTFLRETVENVEMASVTAPAGSVRQEPFLARVRALFRPLILLSMLTVAVDAMTSFAIDWPFGEEFKRNVNDNGLKGLVYASGSITNIFSTFMLPYIITRVSKPTLMITRCTVGGLMYFLVGGQLFSFGPESRDRYILFMFIFKSVMGLTDPFGYVVSNMQVMSEVAGMPNTLELNGLASGLFVQFLNVGDVVGVVLGGYLYDNYGFAWVGNVMLMILTCTVGLQLVLAYMGRDDRKTLPEV